jgi:Zn-dependent alcohol dehydrogenase
MKAAVCYEFGQPLVIDDLEIDPPKEGEVLVRVAATAICHSDVHHVRGDWSQWGTATPEVLGHETAGVVEQVGAGVSQARPGDRVVVSLLRSCGRCFYCARGESYLCEGQFALATERRLHNRRGEAIIQAIKVGSFAEYCVVDQSQVVPIPDSMPFEEASLLACGVITGYGAVVNTARLEPGSSAVIIGTGGVGLNSIQGAALSGANPVIAVDLLDNKLEAALSFGATHAVNSRHAEPRDLVRSLTHGRGADYVFITVGSTAAVTQGLKLLRRGGALVLVGMPARNAAVDVPIGDFVYDGIRMLGSNIGSARAQVDIPRLVELFQSGRLKLTELISRRYPLEQINEAIESMERGEALRNVIVFP